MLIERVVLGVGKGVLFRELSSIQDCPHRGIHNFKQVLQEGEKYNILQRLTFAVKRRREEGLKGLYAIHNTQWAY